MQNFKNDIANIDKNGVHLDRVYAEMIGFVTLDYKANNIISKLINKKAYSPIV